VFRKFQSACEEQITGLERTFKHASLNHLLTSLFKCQQIAIRDKFFYEALINQIHQNMGSIVRAKDMVLLGVTLGGNPEFQKDHPEVIKDFYAHVYKHRFMLSMEDRKALNTIFSEINVVAMYKKHLDLFAEMPRKEVA
jgi:hypothetical protein